MDEHVFGNRKFKFSGIESVKGNTKKIIVDLPRGKHRRNGNIAKNHILTFYLVGKRHQAQRYKEKQNVEYLNNGTFGSPDSADDDKQGHRNETKRFFILFRDFSEAKSKTRRLKKIKRQYKKITRNYRKARKSAID